MLYNVHCRLPKGYYNSTSTFLVVMKWEKIHAFLFAGSNPPEYHKSQQLNLKYASKFTLKGQCDNSLNTLVIIFYILYVDGELLFKAKRVVKTQEDAKRPFQEF